MINLIVDEMIKKDIDVFFNPKSIAVIASFKESPFGGYPILKQLLTFGFSYRIYPVNPRYEKILGLKVYPIIRDVPETVDLAIIITPRDTVPRIVKDCTEVGVKGIIITTDGFAERDEEGAKLQQEITNIAKQSSIRILGPNTIGTTNTSSGLITTQVLIGYEKIKKGSVAFCAQSGIAGAQAFPLEDIQYGFSKICDFGNK